MRAVAPAWVSGFITVRWVTWLPRTEEANQLYPTSNISSTTAEIRAWWTLKPVTGSSSNWKKISPYPSPDRDTITATHNANWNYTFLLDNHLPNRHVKSTEKRRPHPAIRKAESNQGLSLTPHTAIPKNPQSVNSLREIEARGAEKLEVRYSVQLTESSITVRIEYPI